MAECANKENINVEEPAFKKRRSKQDSPPISSCVRIGCTESISPVTHISRAGTGEFEVSPCSTTTDTLPDDSPSSVVHNRKRTFGKNVCSPVSGRGKTGSDKARIESLRKNFGQQTLKKLPSISETPKAADKVVAFGCDTKTGNRDSPAPEKMDTDVSPASEAVKQRTNVLCDLPVQKASANPDESKKDEKTSEVAETSKSNAKVDKHTTYKAGKILIGKDEFCSPEVAEKELLSLLPDGFDLGVLLGEGGFGKVFLVKNAKSNDVLACKVSMHYGQERQKEYFLREGRMQKIFHHENICRAYGFGSGPNMVAIFMELIIGAELFNLIPLGVGISLDKGFNYFKQILSAVEYLHQLGFAHFDIKPENVIVNDAGVAKLVDFGYGCMYRYKDQLRPVKGRRGTRPYSAPETLQLEVAYDPLPADIFSLGVTLLTIVSGERVWREASRYDSRYLSWRRREIQKVKALRRLPLDLLHFLQGVLAHRARKRLTIEAIRQHVWYQAGERGQLQQQPLRTAEARLVPKRHMSASQPEFSSATASSFEPSPTLSKTISFSQPADKVFLMTGPCHMVDEQPDASFNPRCIMRRMTRFFSRLDVKTTMERLHQAIAGEIHIEVTNRGPGTLLVEARGQVSFTARVVLIRFARSAASTSALSKGMRTEPPILVEFRRAGGDGFALLEFYKSVYGTLLRLKVVDEDHPYLEMLNTPRPNGNCVLTPSERRMCEETKEKTM